MRSLVFLAILTFVPAQFPPPSVDAPKPDVPQWLTPYREPASRLIGAALASDEAWQRLAYIGDTFGNRLSGSPNLDAAIAWAVEAAA